jgi:8-oxo-dGTP diphosphatase
MQEQGLNHFNVRVYGLVLNENKQLLVADEYCQQRYMTKFPGGGLEFGEGLIDGLKREFVEECGQEVEVLEHFYTTDFYVKSMFRGGGQLISVYYICRFREEPQFPTTSKPFEGMSEIDDTFTFRWIALNDLHPEDVTWPIDKKVVEMLKEANLPLPRFRQ